MAQEFDVIIDRRGTGSYKWDSAADLETIPMWVADMDFRTAPAIVKALESRVSHGIFGYTKVPDAYFDAMIGWFNRRHSFLLKREWILFTTGVVPALSAIIGALTKPGDGVIVQAPVYNCFFSSIRNMQCELLSNDLIYENGSYKVDFKDLEEKASGPNARLLLLCNPHNPVGRVWSTDELTQIGEICFRNDVIVVSDEVHCDIVFPGYKHVPFGSLGADFLKQSVTCSSPSKAFNVAGLQVANIVANDADIYRKIDRMLNVHEVCDVNPFGVVALIAAYNESENWLDRLNDYIYQNHLFLLNFISEHLPHIHVVPIEATYLAWLDCSALQAKSSNIALALFEQEKLWVSEGTIFGPQGEGFLRLNMACPRSVLITGLERLRHALNM